MKISINGNTDIVSAEGGSTVGQILKQLREFLRNERLVVASLVLDGELLTAANEVDYVERLTVDYSRLEVEAQSMLSACSELLRTVEESVDPLVSLIKQVVEQLQKKVTENLEGNLNEIFSRFEDIKKGMGMVCGIAGISFTELLVDGDTFTEKVNDMTEILQELHENMSNSDATALAETLEFELAERLTEWRRAAVVLREKLCEPVPKSNDA